MQLHYAYSQLAEMSISKLMTIANNPESVRSCRLSAIEILEEKIRKNYGIVQSQSLDVLPKHDKKSLLKLWIVLKNKAKPEGWTLKFFSFDYAHERQLFEDEEMIQSRFENENVYFLKNFYGFKKPLHGYERLYNYALKMYRQRKLIHFRIYLNTYFQENENGDFLPTEIQSWSIQNKPNADESDTKIVTI